jgi:predicted LPLAT superfamily acyltransferase
MDFSEVDYTQREVATQQAMQRYVQLIEQYCAESPYNWFNFFDFWQKAS